MQEHTQRNETIATDSPRITAIVLANPTSGSYAAHASQIEDTIAFLRDQGWDATLKLTEKREDVRRITRAAVEQKIDVVVVAGGDGTINEVIQELAGSETALGVLPSGTVNVWAREVGIPLNDPDGAREVLVHGQRRQVDLGKVNGRYFLLMSTIGFDAEVTRAVEKKSAKRFGVLGYIMVGLRAGLHYPDFRVIIQDGKRATRLSALQVVIGNTQLYAGAIKFTWQAKADDGLLDICVVRTRSILERAAVLVNFLLRRPQRRRWVRYETSDEVKIYTHPPVAMQVDGDPASYTSGRSSSPTIFSVTPRALKVIVPQDVPEPLFSRG
jgi:diacylglycerol kinase (ATP)